MTTTAKDQDRQVLLDKMVDNKKVFGTSFAIKYKGEIWQGSSGNISNEQQYFIASTTKLFVTAIVLNLQSKDLYIAGTVNQVAYSDLSYKTAIKLIQKTLKK